MSFNAESVKQLVYDFAENSASVDKKAYRILLQACSNEIAMSEYVRDWYSAKSKETYTNKKGEEKTRYTYPHATDITNCRTSKDIVEAYYKAFETALDGENNDETVAYQEIHEEVLLTLCKYFVTAFVSCLEEQFGDSFVEFYCARVDYYEAQKALEIARTNKVIGAALDAKIELFCEGELYDFVKSVEGELKDVCIVSQAKVLGEGEGEFKGEAVPGLSVTVSHAEGQKCARCWSYTNTVGSSEKHPDVCSRCAEVLG